MSPSSYETADNDYGIQEQCVIVALFMITITIDDLITTPKNFYPAKRTFNHTSYIYVTILVYTLLSTFLVIKSVVFNKTKIKQFLYLPSMNNIVRNVYLY